MSALKTCAFETWNNPISTPRHIYELRIILLALLHVNRFTHALASQLAYSHLRKDVASPSVNILTNPGLLGKSAPLKSAAFTRATA